MKKEINIIHHQNKREVSRIPCWYHVSYTLQEMLVYLLPCSQLPYQNSKQTLQNGHVINQGRLKPYLQEYPGLSRSMMPYDLQPRKWQKPSKIATLAEREWRPLQEVAN